jgi:cytochrome c oxidase assembly protein subunit 15
MRWDPESRWPHRLAAALACATFLLICAGGAVTTYEAGMAIPDWPTTYGYLLLYPWRAWLFGPWDLFLAHSHRLLAAAVGLLTIALVVVVFLGERRRWVRVLTLIALGAVVFQGCLGGARVLFDERALAMLHGCLARALLALCVSLAVVTSRHWSTPPAPQSLSQDVLGAGLPTPPEPATEGLRERFGMGSKPRGAADRLRPVALLMTLLTYVQVVLGAQLRHISVDASPGAFRAAVFSHLIVASVVTAHALILTWIVGVRRGDSATLRRPVLILAALTGCQLLLGGGTYVVTYFWPNWLSGFSFAAGYAIEAAGWLQSLTATAHAATGSLVLAFALVVLLRSARRWSWQSSSPKAAVAMTRATA